MSYRMPAEWEPQDSIWFAWPTNRDLWPGNRENALDNFAKLLITISQYTLINLLCPEEDMKFAHKILKRHGAKYHQITFIDIETDDVWCRDFGPIFVKNDKEELTILNWQFNAWGSKFPYELDNLANGDIAGVVDLPKIDLAVILEGGAIDVNGKGLLLTTEEVLLNDNRNKGLSKSEYGKLFQEYLGVDKTIWLNKGLYNDDTDGHIDNIARFITEDTVLMAVDPDENSLNYAPLQENLEIIRKFSNDHNLDLKIIEIPLPDEVTFDDKPLPVSHLNFLMSNELIIVPTFDSSTDKKVLNIFRKIFPTKTVQGFDCRDFVQEGGAIHCLSQQQPF